MHHQPGHPRRGDGADPLAGADVRDVRASLMGIVNVTPDSFSDGGGTTTPSAPWPTAGPCCRTGRTSSTSAASPPAPVRPGPLVAEELDRVVPVITRARRRRRRRLRPHHARRGRRGGDRRLRDDRQRRLRRAGRPADPRGRRWRTDARTSRCTGVRTADRMRDFAVYAARGVVAAVRRELAARASTRRLAAGISSDRIGLYLGLGFAKRPEHNWELLTRPRALAGAGLPAAGRARAASRSSVRSSRGGGRRAVDEREHAHAALVALLAGEGSGLPARARRPRHGGRAGGGGGDGRHDRWCGCRVATRCGGC